MTALIQSRLFVPLLAVVAAVAGWHYLPGTVADRLAFSSIARATANPPFVISGSGAVADPWQLRTLEPRPQVDEKSGPLMVSLGDDLEGVFQSSPPSPIDVAVILNNFHRLGARNAAISAVLAWDEPDPISLVALDQALGKFDSLVMAAPLTRGAVAETMPPSFRRASIPQSEVIGDLNALPLVNRVPLPGVILEREKSLAGFQVLESEPASDQAPLLARWDDRLVLAFPLLTAMQSLGLPVDGLEVRLGEFLKLGPDGPYVPIDAFGRLATALVPVKPMGEIPAVELIDGGDALFPQNAPQPVILRDDRSAAEAATHSFSASLPAIIAAIRSDTGMKAPRLFRRFTASPELVLVALVLAVVALLARMPDFPRNTGYLALTLFCFVAQLVAVWSGFWLPGLAALGGIATAFVLGVFTPDRDA